MLYPKHLSQFIKFYKIHKRLPSYREILKLVNFKSTNAAYKLVEKFIVAGWLRRDSSGKIIPGKRFVSVPMLGVVEAGWPSPAEEELVDTLSLEEWLIGNREATYLLKVSGESMIDAGIRPGDVLLVERGRTPKNGDVVVAEVDNAWTVKYYQTTAGRVTLMPANKKFLPVTAKTEMRIAAVVMANIRKYH